jgi:hypothetical protein
MLPHAQIELLNAARWHGINDARLAMKEAANWGGLIRRSGRN